MPQLASWMSYTVSPINYSWPVINFQSSDGEIKSCSQSVGASTLKINKQTNKGLKGFRLSITCSLCVSHAWYVLEEHHKRKSLLYILKTRDSFVIRKPLGSFTHACFCCFIFVLFCFNWQKRNENIDVGTIYYIPVTSHCDQNTWHRQSKEGSINLSSWCWRV